MPPVRVPIGLAEVVDGVSKEGAASEAIIEKRFLWKARRAVETMVGAEGSYGP
jgi:hypothetical protein